MQAIQGKELSVAILMDDLASAKEISQALRQNDILAHHYQSLDEFWVSTGIEIPDLVIVDVTKLSQGSIQFRAHPKVQNGQIAFAIFSKDSTKILLQSTIGLKPVAFLHADASLAGQVASMMDLRKKEIAKQLHIQDLEKRVERLQSRSQRLISDRSAAEEFRSHFEFMRTFCGEIEAEAIKQDFTKVLLNKLEDWQAVDGYGIFELSQNGQKLISPESGKRKFHPFPSLWLGQANIQGIEVFAQDMAQQVANDLFEIEPVSIRIHGAANLPDLLLFISFKEERMMNFPWDVFESSLSSSFRRMKLYRELPQYSTQFMPMWEALDGMDKMQSAGVESDQRIVCLSFIPLTDVAKRRSQNKFYWSSFFNDFFLQLSGRLQKTTKLSLFGPWQVVFFIPRENVETETQMLNGFIRQFSYWKFFEENSQVLSEDTLPTIRLMPASSSHYFRLFEREMLDQANLSEARAQAVATPRDTRRISF